MRIRNILAEFVLLALQRNHYNDDQVWNKLSDHVTATSGFTLAQAIACAVEFDDQESDPND
jgi:hypothetical protein